MMTEASFASLGPTLLARKGGAKPAMRPQLTPLPDNMAEISALADEQLEDLGWNDMGADDAEGSDRPLTISTTPAPTLEEGEAAQEDNPSGPHPIIDPLASAQIVPIGKRPGATTPANEDTLDVTTPVVLRHQKRLARRILGEAVASHMAEAVEAPLLRPKTPKAPKTTGKRSRASKKPQNARRAAFTLRLDTDRHLKLRLAATMQGVSAQSLVTDALDALLEGIEDLDALVERMKRD